MSLAAGVDISPCLEFWGWSLTDKVQKALDAEGLQPYFFKNDITEEVSPSRRDFILGKYPGVNRQVCNAGGTTKTDIDCMVKLIYLPPATGMITVTLRYSPCSLTIAK